MLQEPRTFNGSGLYGRTGGMGFKHRPTFTIKRPVLIRFASFDPSPHLVVQIADKREGVEQVFYGLAFVYHRPDGIIIGDR